MRFAYPLDSRISVKNIFRLHIKTVQYLACAFTRALLIINDQYRQLGKLLNILRLNIIYPEIYGNCKDRTLSRLAFYMNISAHHSRDIYGYRHTETASLDLGYS